MVPIYVGGDFGAVNGASITTNCFARWDGANWHSSDNIDIDNGQENVSAILIDGSDVYLAGTFLSIDGNSAASMAQINNGSWSPMGDSVGGFAFVEAAAMMDGDLYVGGSFNEVNGISANNIVKWNGSTWSALSSGVDGEIYSMVVIGSNLAVNSILLVVALRVMLPYGMVLAGALQ